MHIHAIIARHLIYGWLTVLLAGAALAPTGLDAREDIVYPDAAFKKLDTFEAHSLSKADKLFRAKDWRQGAAAYEAFLQEFPNSAAIPYVILQKGRCLLEGNKRNAAVKVFTEVLDYFPNQVDFAAPALFFIGDSHWQNGDTDKALRAWTKMAKDAGYRKHFLAAGALNKLADQLSKRGEIEQALPFYIQVAVDFRSAHPTEARHARERAVRLLVRKMDEPGLRKLYADAGTFQQRSQKVEGDVTQMKNYWAEVMAAIKLNGQFKKSEEDAQRDQYFRYWAKQLEGRFVSWDDLQIARIDFQRVYEKDAAQWAERLDAQFNSGTTDSASRIVKWIGLFLGKDDARADAYLAKLDLDKAGNKNLIPLMRLYFETKDREKSGRAVFRHIRLKQLSDHDKRNQLVKILWRKDAGLVRDTCLSFKELNEGKRVLLEFYLQRGDAKNGIPLANELATEAKFAKIALYWKGELLRHTKQYKEAIAAYQQSDYTPHSLFKIAECLEGQGQPKSAVAQLREIENFFKDQRSEAMYRIAQVHRKTKDKKMEASALRELMTKYPKSGQSARAHERLEEMGVRIKGGVNVER